ncbi:uncharacterized protein DUF1515 [Agrobacterium vitis]|nr:uncharacterized protein DUF1515 [Agrobacterium vitis]
MRVRKFTTRGGLSTGGAHMAPEIDAGVHRMLGELVAEMRGLKEDIQEIRGAQVRSEDRATQSRAVVHRRMDEMVDRVGALETNITNVQTDIADIKPVTNEVKRWKLIGLGALGMIGIGGIALGVSFADVLKRVGGLLIGRL